MSSGTSYSFSADILDVAGQTFNLFIADGANTLKSANVTWTGTGNWRRRSVTWTADANATFRLFVTRSAIASTTVFYTDGWQLEVGEVSTYIDGWLTGYVNGQTAYVWNGTPGASTSWRSGQTRSGGTYLKLSSIAKLAFIVGLGMAPLTNMAVGSSLGGSHYQNTIYNERPFSLVMNLLSSGGDYGVIQKARASLINAVKPDLTGYRQPVLMQYDAYDANSLEVSETL
jgi:hypothetical protein